MIRNAKRIVVLVAALAYPGFLVSAVTAPPFGPLLNWRQPLERGSILQGAVTNIDPVNQMLFLKDRSGIVHAIVVDDDVQIEDRDHSVKLHNVSIGEDVTLSK